MTNTSKLADNVLHFGRTLRRAGLPIGTGRVLTALQALEVAGLTKRDDFYWTLYSCFISRQDQIELFNQAFHAFWRDPQILEQVSALLQPQDLNNTDEQDEKQTLNRRIADAFSEGLPDNSSTIEKDTFDLDTSDTWSAEEVFKTLDFDQMSAEEIAQAKHAIRSLTLPFDLIRTRRNRRSSHGRNIDVHGSLRSSLRFGGDIIPLQWKKPIERPAPITAICDISGSMSQYSRMVLHFLHTLTLQRDRISSFVFGTHLTNITRHLQKKDVDESLRQVGSEVTDWGGGTNIGRCLHTFNRDWSRRVLRSDSTVLLVTDGLDREDVEVLSREAERLQKSCKRLIWLNPLLRFDGFAPKARGIRALLPHIDEFRAVHNIRAMEDLVESLSSTSFRLSPNLYLRQMQSL